MGRRILFIPLVILGLIVFAALFADFIMPHKPNLVALRSALLPPSWQPGGNPTYLLGTDYLGRDMLSRIILGARVSLLASFASIVLGGSIGIMLGLLSGYYGGKIDSIIMRAADAALAFPMLLLALLLAVALGPSLQVVILVIGLVLWSRFARLVRGEVLSLKTREFVALAKVAGAPSWRIILRHIFPNTLNTIVVLATLQVGWAILVEASLSFLGAGIPPPTPTWGSMVAQGRDYISSAWWIAMFPGLAIVATVMSFNLLGDWLRDALDPKLRQV